MPSLPRWSTDSKPVMRYTSNRKVRHGAIPASAGLLCLSLSSTSVVVQALEFHCEAPGDTRTLSVDIPGEQYLCEVAVTDAQTGIRDVKWYASNDTLFCSARAYEMRDKYEDTWNYTCTRWPDLDGIDVLSASQRLILDERLKAVIAQGREALPPFTITGLRAVASTPLDEDTGKLAFQYFKEQSNGDYSDFTEIIDDEVQSWRVSATIDSLMGQLDDITPDGSALINGISADGALKIHSTFTNDEDALCYGSLILSSTNDSSTLAPITPHRYLCRSDETDPATLSGVSSE